LGKNFVNFPQNTAVQAQRNSLGTVFPENSRFCPKSAKVEEISDHNITPWDRCYDFLNIIAKNCYVVIKILHNLALF
jgi:hypothetical protein